MGIVKESTLAYIAGFHDGEGTITLIKQNKNSYISKVGKVKRSDYYYLAPRLYIGANTDKAVLEWCRQELNIGALLLKHSEIGNWKPHYTLLITDSKKILSLLHELLPFLKVKKKHAELMIEFLQSRLARKSKIIQNPENGKIIGFIGKPYTDRELEIYKEIHKLNLKGNQNMEMFNLEGEKSWA